MHPALPWRHSQHGLTVTVRLTPKGGRDALDGVTSLADGTPVLRVRVRAAPHEGAANAALVAVLAKALAVPQGRVALVSGQSARVKTMSVEGESASLAARLEKALGMVPA